MANADVRFGDSTLAAQLAKALGRRGRAAAVATIHSRESAVASVHAPLEADYEIGSVSKGITGLLYADAVDRGEVSPTSTLGELLPMPESDASRVTLGALVTHTSGLPRLPAAAEPWKRQIALWRHGTNPYGETLSELLNQARDVKLSAPKPRYSNLGFELLGHAVASAAGMSYAELVRARLTVPLAMDSSYVPSTGSELRPTTIAGVSRSGKPREAWTGEAIGPAGGVRSSIGDLAKLVTALLDGSAPGITALDPVLQFSRGARIGAAWLTLDVRGRHITWHNGATGGFRSWVGIDRAAGIGVVVLSAATAPPDGLGFRLMQQLNSPGKHGKSGDRGTRE
jgi:CubicO group peptidase (beta-lactamase class C family)